MKDTKAALVTGGGTRIGAHFALTLAEKGYDIALHYNSSEKQACDVANNIESLGQRCKIFKLDFSCGDSYSELILKAFSHFPKLELLVNSASTYDAFSTEDTSFQILEKQFTVNLFAPYLLAKHFAQTVKSGNVINILDNKIAYQQYHYSAYLLSKKSLAEFTTMAAVEFAPKIRVNGIAPGVILPAEVRTDKYLDWRKEGIPLMCQGDVGQLSQAISYLLANDFVTGQILFVDGGESINLIGRNSENYHCC